MRWRPLRGLGPWWVVAVVALVGLVLTTVGGHFRVGGFVVAASLVLAALVRAVLPPARSGGLAIRSRPFDVLVMLVAAALVFAAFLLVRTCGPSADQVGGGRAANCPAELQG